MQKIPLIEFHNVNKFFSQKHVLNNVSFSVFTGEIVALLGVNGAGKTTTINLMLGQDAPSSGNVTLLEGNPQLPANRMRVGCTPQNVEFPEGIRVKEVLKFVADHYLQPFEISYLVSTFELASFLEEKANKLSGGQKRRLALALAFLGNPDVIFLDEPTTGLDVGARKVLWNFIKQQSKKGKTIFLTTHYLEEIEQIATRVIFLHQGQIKIDGTVEDVKQSAASSLVMVCFQCPSAFDVTKLKTYVKHTQEENSHLFETTDPDSLVRELVLEKIPFQQLSIQRENLESAFLNLSRSDDIKGDL
jgi:ABC-2 type transport system ATP-binding protein